MSVNSMPHVSVALQGGKKMKKRRELDALVARRLSRRREGEGGKRCHDKLLSESTDEQEYWTSSVGGKPLRCQRRSYLARKRTCSTFFKACSAILVFTCVVATTAVMWLFIDVREQVTSLRTELNQEVAGIQEVPDALQKCHTLSKDLQKNQTEIIGRLRGFSFLLTNFSSVMEKVKSDLETVQDQLKSSPDLINNPLLLKELSASVASFGSQIKDFNSTVSTLKEQYGKADALLLNLVNNVTQIDSRLTTLSNAQLGKGLLTERAFASEKDAILSAINNLSKNLSLLNDTLTNKLLWTSQDQSKDHSLIESLREMNENLTARVKTLEGLRAKEREAEALSKSQNPVRTETISNPSSGSPESPSLKTFPRDRAEANALQNPP